jgi:hypothetical protein
LEIICAVKKLGEAWRIAIEKGYKQQDRVRGHGARWHTAMSVSFNI